MRARFISLWRQLGASGDPEPVFTDLAARYREPHRSYHTLDHIAQCLDEFASAQHLLREPLTVEMAIWYHDAIYTIGRRDNEEQSATFAWGICAGAGLGQQFSGTVADLIRMTATHHAADNGGDERVFADIDLSILGQPPAAFAAYDAAIHREYVMLGGVDATLFRVKRAEILSEFLQRAETNQLYTTSFFQQKYGTPARENLRSAVAALR